MTKSSPNIEKKKRGKTKRYSINYEEVYGKGNTPNDKRIKKLKNKFQRKKKTK